MKNACRLLVIIVAAFILILKPEPVQAASDLRSFLMAEAESYLAAYLHRDYETCLGMMGGGIVNDLGGKIAVLNHYHATEEALKLHHMKLETMTVEEPGPVVSDGAARQFVVIPEKHCYSAKDGNYILNSYILAVSENGGRSWNMLEGSWRISEHIKNKNLLLYDRLKLPVRKLYFADDPKIMMLEKGGGFITPPETIEYKQRLRQRGNPPAPQPKRPGSY